MSSNRNSSGSGLTQRPERITLERLEIPARKTGTTVEEVVLAWVPRAEFGP